MEGGKSFLPIIIVIAPDHGFQGTEIFNLHLAAQCGIHFNFFLKQIHLPDHHIRDLEIDIFVFGGLNDLICFAIQGQQSFLLLVNIFMP